MSILDDLPSELVCLKCSSKFIRTDPKKPGSYKCIFCGVHIIIKEIEKGFNILVSTEIDGKLIDNFVGKYLF